MTRRCSKCGLSKEDSEFARNRRRPDGIDAWCKQCHRESSRRYREANPNKVKVSTRAYRERHPEKVAFWRSTRANRRINLKARFDMTPEQFDELLAVQGGVCAICQSHRVRDGRYNMHVDHDHATGAVRGILCHGCNAGIGLFEESAERFSRAAEYLRWAKDNPTGFFLRSDKRDRRKAQRPE